MKGQGFLEYILLVALLALLVVAFVAAVSSSPSTGPVAGTVEDKFITCPSDNVEIKTQSNGEQVIVCQGTQDNVVVVLNGTKVELQTIGSIYSNLEIGQEYLFTYQSGQITQYSTLK